MEKAKGIVIKCMDYSETSQLVWLYTEFFGKLKVIAKGSRRQGKNRRGRFDLFALCEINFYNSRRSDLHTLGDYAVINPFNGIRLFLDRFAAASYIAELVNIATPAEDPCRELFGLLYNVLSRMAGGGDTEFMRCVFGLKLMQYTGNIPQFCGLSTGAGAVVNRILKSEAFFNIKVSSGQLREIKDALRLSVDSLAGKRLKSLEFAEELFNETKN